LCTLNEEKIRLNNIVKLFGLILALATLCGSAGMSQEIRIMVQDEVDLPLVMEGHAGQDLIISFKETWNIKPVKGSIKKQVESFSVLDHNNVAAADSLLEKLKSIAPLTLEQVSYEFMLVDPETGQKNNLHGDITILVSKHSSMASKYDLQQQLYSINFLETWKVDPDMVSILKKVVSITPVIWQRRQTEAGDPVDDAESGLPVYYKIQLDKINLY
jgi:hypothetical protein